MSAPKREGEVVLQWTYSPKDFFESDIEISRSDYTLDINAGSISARMPASVFDADTTIQKRLHSSLVDRMRGIQLLSRKAFELSKPNLTRIDSTGRRHIFVELEGGELKVTGGVADIVITDATGKVIHDSKQARIDQKRTLADLVAKYAPGDDLLNSMLKSYATSTSDANNELVHLYEVRDSLSKAFGGESHAKSKLNISNKSWSRLGQLSNDEPLRQGRHRGRKFKDLRDATEAELSEARDIARQMIEAYLKFRDSGGKISR